MIPAERDQRIRIDAGTFFFAQRGRDAFSPFRIGDTRIKLA
jgi:hypothetical protein